MDLLSEEKTAELLWCALPELTDYLLLPPPGSAAKSLVRSTVLPRRVALTEWRCSAFRDGLVAAVEGTNPDRALRGVTRGADEKIVGLDAPIGRARRSAYSPAARKLRSWSTSFLRNHRRLDTLSAWHFRIDASARELERCHAINWRRFRFLLLAQSHDVPVRAMISAAQAQGVPVVLLPEGPLTRKILDVPAAYAGRRGNQEIMLLSQLTGVRPAQLAVVGSTTTDILALQLPRIDDDALGVLAVSAYRREILEDTFARLLSAGVDRLTVAPHPRSDMDELKKILPSGWSVYESGRTLDLLKSGPKYLIQSSSGIAWEAAALGIPTADLAVEGLGRMERQYPFLDDAELFPSLATPDDVRAFVSAVSTGSFNRDRLRTLALTWCEFDGDQAVERVLALLDSVEQGKEPRRIVDGWAPGGPAWSNSPVARTIRS